MGLGGPVWHASIAPHSVAAAEDRELMRSLAYRALVGVGDPELGQWEEWGEHAFHLRRRLSATEALVTGPVVDIRDDEAEVNRRLKPVRSLVGWDWTEKES